MGETDSKKNNEWTNEIYIFPPTPQCYNMSPFGIKLESYFRINQIPYEPRYCKKVGSKGMIPYLIRRRKQSRNTTNQQEEDKVEICDSNVIIDFLRNEYDSTDLTLLTSYERATSHCVIRMLEEHTSQIGFHYRYGRNIEQFFQALEIGDRFFDLSDQDLKDALVDKDQDDITTTTTTTTTSTTTKSSHNDHDDTNHNVAEDAEEKKKQIKMMNKKIYRMSLEKQPNITLTRSKHRGLDRHSDEELYQFSNDDLQALEDLLLPEYNFFFGKEQATTIDCAVFGHVSQFLYIPNMDFPQKIYLQNHCHLLLRFMERFKATYWPDWEKKCQKQPMSNIIQ